MLWAFLSRFLGVCDHNIRAIEDLGVGAFSRSSAPAVAPALALPMNPSAAPSKEDVSENHSSTAPCSQGEGEEEGLEILCVHFSQRSCQRAGWHCWWRTVTWGQAKTSPLWHHLAARASLFSCLNATSWGVIGSATSADGDACYKAPASPVAEARASPPWPTRCPPACFWPCCSWPQPCLRHRRSEGLSSTW